MLNAKITIASINYEETFRNLLPSTLEKCRAMESKNLIIRLMQKLDDASAVALSGMLSFLPRESCDELLCIMVRLFGGELAERLNQTLQEHEVGRNLAINAFSLVQEPERGIILALDGIEVDYGSLLQSVQEQKAADGITGGSTGKTAGRLIGALMKKTVDVVSKIPPQQLESKGLYLLELDWVKKKLVEMAQKSLYKKGIVLELEDIIFYPCEENGLESETHEKEGQGAGKKLELSPELEETLLDAMAAWMKSLLCREEPAEYH